MVFARDNYAPGSASGRQLIAHELAHVVQQSHGRATPGVQRKKGKGKGPGSCGWFNAAADTVIGSEAHIQIQAALTASGIIPELPIPRATKDQILSQRCRPILTPFGYADLARTTGPVTGFAEIKPYYIAKTTGRLEARHYRRRAEQSKQRLTGIGPCARQGPGPDDEGFALELGGISPLSSFINLTGIISGKQNFGPFALDPKIDLYAEEVGGGGVGYWCRLNEAGKEAEEEEKLKKKKPPAKGANLGIGVSIGGSSAGAGNVGISVSVDSNSASVGTAGIAITASTDSAAAGAVGASASHDSMGATAGAAGASATTSSEGVGAGAAGASASSDSTSASAGVAGSSTSEDSVSASAGQSGSGQTKDSMTASAGGSGTSKAENVSGVGKGAPKKPIDPKDVSGPEAAKTPDGEQGEAGAEGGKGGDGQGKGDGGGGKKSAGGDGSGQGQGKGGGDATGQGASGQPPSGQGGTVPGAGAAGKDAGGKPGSGDSKSGADAKNGDSSAAGQGTGTGSGANPLGVQIVAPLGTSPAERERLAAEAAKVAALIAKASDAQKALLRHLAQNSQDQRFLVPASQWVQKMMDLTQGLTPEEIEYLKGLNWTPGHMDEAALRARIAELLAKRPKDQTKQDSAASAPADAGSDAKTAGKGKIGAQGNQGKAKGSGTKTDKPAAGASGANDVVVTPPTGSDRSPANDFGFHILSGLTRDVHPAPDTAVICAIQVNDFATERVFKLDKVSITFVSSTETVKNGFVYVSYKVYFTDDFWSEKNKFLGRGGKESLTDVDMGRRKVK